MAKFDKRGIKPMSDTDVIFVESGWIKAPEFVSEMMATEPIKTWQDTDASYVSFDNIPDSMIGAEIAKKAIGKKLPDYSQGSVGSCVGFGTTKSVELTNLYEIAISKEKEEFHTLAQEVTYAGSRVEVGGGKFVGDGSIGAYAVKFLRDWGAVERAKYPSIDLTVYDEAQCRRLGKTGLSVEMEGIAKKHPIKSFTKITNFKDACVALAQGYFITICSSQGFKSSRNDLGFAIASGRWGHCMCISGYQIKRGSNKLWSGCVIDNSWGDNWISGPKGPFDINDGAFWADEEVITSMLAEGDSYAVSSFAGFPKKDVIDWNF